jgi:hypothetical protein
MTKIARKHYKFCHKLAKTITCFLVILLLITSRLTGWFALDILAVVVWFFGVNPIAYLIEHVNKWRHIHEKW